MTLLYFPYLMFIFPILGIFIPLPGVLLAFFVPDWGYVVNQFPPLLCSTQNLNLTYYSLTLPLNVLLAIGTSLFVLMFWKLHKVIIIIMTHFNIPCPHSIKVYLTSGKKASALTLVQQRKRF